MVIKKLVMKRERERESWWFLYYIVLLLCSLVHLKKYIMHELPEGDDILLQSSTALINICEMHAPIFVI